MKKAFGFGKTIILGEHFVVHEQPSLASSLSLRTEAIVQPNDINKLRFIDNRPKAPGFVASKTPEYRQMLENILIFLNIKQKNFDITILGDLPVTCGGIGASAACGVSVIKAFDQYLNLGLDNAKINEAAIFAESAVHGSPSGIDNAAAIFGCTFEYSKQSGIKPLSIATPVKIVLVDSGKQTDTKILISKVKSFLKCYPQKSAKIFEHYKNIFDEGLSALRTLNLIKLGQCMNENHLLLQEIGASCPELDFIVEKALVNGALGAKLTGTGGGGLALILTTEQNQSKISDIFKSDGFFTITTEINS